MLHFSNIRKDLLMKTDIYASLLGKFEKNTYGFLFQRVPNFVIPVSHLQFVLLSDEDLAGDLLLAEAQFPLKMILPQMQKKFQIALEKPDLRVSKRSSIMHCHEFQKYSFVMFITYS